jgi:GxxExxY protein
MEVKYKEITGEVISCAMEVQRILGSGYQEYIFHRAFFKELKQTSLQVEDEVELKIYYKGEMIGLRRVDFLINKIIPVEIKAATILADPHLAQAMNYLECADFEIGLLINFGAPSLQFHRLTNKKFTSLQNPSQSR